MASVLTHDEIDAGPPPAQWDGQHPYAFRWRVYLDGQRVERCWWADVEKGQVVVILADRRGVVDLLKDLQFETRRGRVEIRRAR